MQKIEEKFRKNNKSWNDKDK